MTSSLRVPVAVVVCALSCLCPTRATAASMKWKPVDPADRAMTSGTVQKDADAEALFWEVRVLDEIVGSDTPQTVLEHYIRIKVFTDRGRDAQSKVELLQRPGTEIRNVIGRTIKPDGTIIELKKADVFERTTAKGDGFSFKTTSFVMPGVESGAILEYQWREERHNQLAMYVSLECQRDIPVQLVRYHIKPLSLSGFDFGMRVEAYNGQNTGFVQDKEERGFMLTTMANVPAFHEEPRMPPDHDLKPWLLIYYTPGGRPVEVDKFWRDYNSNLFDAARDFMKPDNAIRDAAKTATARAATVAAKIDALLAVSRKIRRLDLADSLARSDRKAKPAKNAAEVLSRGEGDERDVLLLFGALAQAAGLDAHYASMPDRDVMAHAPLVGHSYFMTSRAIAVRDGATWRFVNAANAYAPGGMLTTGQQGRNVLITDAKQPIFDVTPIAEATDSVRHRTFHLALLDDGSLAGDVTLAYTGHLAADFRERDRSRTAEEREKALREVIADRLPGAEVTDLRFEHLSDFDGDYINAAHVRVPGFAQKTGTRLFLTPAVWQQKDTPMFSAVNRIHPITFRFAWTDHDEVTVTWPEGYSVEPARGPDSVDAPPVGAYRTTLEVKPASRTLIYTRDLSFGSGGRLDFPVNAYGPLKAFFDRTQELDRYTVTMRQAPRGDRE